MSAYDPKRGLTMEEAASLGYCNFCVAPDGMVQSMETKEGYRVTRGAPSYMAASLRAQSLAPTDPRP